jgi:hypothetical protein
MNKLIVFAVVVVAGGILWGAFKSPEKKGLYSWKEREIVLRRRQPYVWKDASARGSFQLPKDLWKEVQYVKERKEGEFFGFQSSLRALWTAPLPGEHAHMTRKVKNETEAKNLFLRKNVFSYANFALKVRKRRRSLERKKGEECASLSRNNFSFLFFFCDFLLVADRVGPERVGI